MTDSVYSGMVIGNRPAGVSGGVTSGLASMVATLMGESGYSNLRGDFDAAITSTTEIVLSNILAALSIDAASIVAIGMRPVAGTVDWNWIYQRGSGKLKISWTGGTNTITFADAVLVAAGYEAFVWLEGPPRYQRIDSAGVVYLDARSPAYDLSAGANRYTDVNPIDTRGQPDLITDETNMTDGAYPFYQSMERFRREYVQMILNGGSGTVTVTLEASVQAGEDPTILGYEDVTNEVFGVVGWTADDIAADYLEKLSGFTWLKWLVTAATGGANDADARLDSYRLY